MLVDDALRVYRGWGKAPPTHRLVAHFMGVKPAKAPPAAQVSDEAALDAIMAEARASMGTRHGG